jgi:mRNA interferase MazF
MTTGPGAAAVQAPNYRRGDIWMIDYGNPVGTELGMEHPGVIVSTQALNNTAAARVIVVPATSTQYTNSKGRTLLSHREVPASKSNGLDHTTYFMAEQVRSLSTRRLRRLVGSMEQGHVKEIEDRICLVLDLFKR